MGDEMVLSLVLMMVSRFEQLTLMDLQLVKRLVATTEMK